MNVFDTLHDDRAKHRATFGPGVRFQKNNPGISRGLGVKSGFFDFFLETLLQFFFFTFCMMIEVNTVQHLA